MAQKKMAIFFWAIFPWLFCPGPFLPNTPLCEVLYSYLLLKLERTPKCPLFLGP